MEGGLFTFLNPSFYFKDVRYGWQWRDVDVSKGNSIHQSTVPLGNLHGFLYGFPRGWWYGGVPTRSCFAENSTQVSSSCFPFRPLWPNNTGAARALLTLMFCFSAVRHTQSLARTIWVGCGLVYVESSKQWSQLYTCWERRCHALFK